MYYLIRSRIKVWNDDFRIGTGCIDFLGKNPKIQKGNKFEKYKRKKVRKKYDENYSYRRSSGLSEAILSTIC